MKNILAVVGVVLLVIGGYETSQTLSFLSRAITLPAAVTAVELRSGPPKPTQNTPVHVTFTLPSGEARSAITHLPLLQNIREGDTIHLLVDRTNPQEVKLPLLSELWARPLSFLLSGMLVVVAVLIFTWVPRMRVGKTQ